MATMSNNHAQLLSADEIAQIEVQRAIEDASRQVANENRFVNRQFRMIKGVRIAMPRRSLNSYMAFRAYYTACFRKLQQKKVSSFIKKMWDVDPFKGKWTLVARAYSQMRNATGHQLPLDQYLNLVCPRIGIIGVAAYLAQMNFAVVINSGGNIELVHLGPRSLQSFPAAIAATNLTDKDLIIYCGQQGYVSNNFARELIRPSNYGPDITVGQAVLVANGVIPGPDDYVQRALANPTATGSVILGFEVEKLLQPAAEPAAQPARQYAWTGSSSDVWNSDAATIEFEDTNELVGDISDPQSIDDMCQSGEGFMLPAVPDMELPEWRRYWG